MEVMMIIHSLVCMGRRKEGWMNSNEGLHTVGRTGRLAVECRENAAEILLLMD